VLAAGVRTVGFAQSDGPELVLRKDLADPSHIMRNRETWDADAPNWVERNRTAWTSEPHWGELGVPDAQISAMPEVAGRDVIENLVRCATGRGRAGNGLHPPTDPVEAEPMQARVVEASNRIVSARELWVLRLGHDTKYGGVIF